MDSLSSSFGDTVSRKLKVGMVGGGVDSFMGEIHRAAIESCGNMEIVCGAFGSTRHNSFVSGKALGLPANRVYGTYRDMFRREAGLPAEERMEFVTVVSSNAMHYPVAMSATDSGFSVFSEKPYTCNVDEGLNLTRKLRESDLKYGIAMIYKNYPMLREARRLIEEGATVGNIRRVVSTYQLGWMTQRLENAGSKQAGWRADPRRCGYAGCLTDLNTHCFHVAEWLTGLCVKEVCGDKRPAVAGRILDDDCDVLVRFCNGARGVFLSSQIAAGASDGLSIEVYGDKGSLCWAQHKPDQLEVFTLESKSTATLTGGIPEGRRKDEITLPYGNNTAYIAALAEGYKGFLKMLEAKTHDAANSIATDCMMSVDEGLRAVLFVDSVMKNCAVPEGEEEPLPDKWMPLVIPPIPEL